MHIMQDYRPVQAHLTTLSYSLAGDTVSVFYIPHPQQQTKIDRWYGIINLSICIALIIFFIKTSVLNFRVYLMSKRNEFCPYFIILRASSFA